MKRVLLALFALSACNSGVRGLGDDQDALAVVRGRVTIDPRLIPDPTHLRAGIIWAGVPVFVPFCHERGPTPLDPDREVPLVAETGCRDPFEVVPGVLGPSVPFDPAVDTSFEIPLEHLPPADAMVGTLASRVAYGSVVIFDDEDGDGVLDLGTRCRRRELNEDPEPVPEPIYAASFTKLNARQIRIAYVEGELDQDSFFYPHPNCVDLPPRGFSVWNVGNLLDPKETCSVAPIDQELVLEVQHHYTGGETNLACWPSERDAFTRPPPENGTGSNVLFACTPAGELVVTDHLCPCPSLRVYALRGCFDDAACTTPDWDVDAPEGWPCPAP